MQPSLYAKYIKERENIDIVEREYGFATYQINPPTVYIRDIYVDADHRNSSIAADLADSIVAKARSEGCNRLLGTVIPSLHGATTSLKVLLAYGMRLDSATNNLIIFIKDI